MCPSRRASCEETSVLPKRRASSRSSFSVTARSMTAARSPSGTSVRRSAVSRSSLSRSSALAVNWTLKRAGASGSTKAVLDGGGTVGEGLWSRRRLRHHSSRDEFVGCWVGGVRLDSSREERWPKGAAAPGPRRAKGLVASAGASGLRRGRPAAAPALRPALRSAASSGASPVRGAPRSCPRQKRHEPREATQVEPAVPERLQDCRVPACRAGYGDAAVGLGLREMQVLRAVREHRWEGMTGEEPSLVDLADVGDEVGLDAARLRHELPESPEQLVIGNGSKRESEL